MKQITLTLGQVLLVSAIVLDMATGTLTLQEPRLLSAALASGFTALCVYLVYIKASDRKWIVALALSIVPSLLYIMLGSFDVYSTLETLSVIAKAASPFTMRQEFLEIEIVEETEKS